MLSIVGPIGVSVSTAASVAPPWEPDVNAAPPYGNIVFYGATGNEITSGTNLNSPFAYAVANSTADTKATKASLNFYNPGSNGSSLPANWTGTGETAVTQFNPATDLPAGTPPDIVAYAPTHPVNLAGGASVTSWLTQNTPNPAPYANIIQVRLTDSGPGGHGNAAGTYWATDIGYNTTSSAITVDGTTIPAKGWSELFPFVTATTTTLTLSPSTSPQPSGTKIKLTATVSTTAAGTVRFFDGSTFLADVTPSAGTAAFSASPAVGSHSYTATFVPTVGDETGANTASAAILGGSTSAAASMTISATTAAPTVTKIAPTSGPTAGGTTVVITGTNLTGATKVVFGSVAAKSFTVNSATKITAVSPAQAAAVHNIIVTTPSGTSPTVAADEFTYD
jgi:large repetitive protein